MAKPARPEPFDRRLPRLEPVLRHGLKVWSAAADTVRGGVPLPRSTAARSPVDAGPFAEVLLPRAGEVWCGGDRVDFEELRSRLYAFAELERDLDHPWRPSLVPALLVVGGDVLWREVRQVMRACADPSVRLPRLWWAVVREDGTEGAFPAFLGAWPGDALHLWIRLARREEEIRTRIKLFDEELGAGEDAHARLEERARAIFPEVPGLVTRIDASARIPFAEVVRVVDLVRSAGGGSIDFTEDPWHRGRDPEDQGR